VDSSLTVLFKSAFDGDSLLIFELHANIRRHHSSEGNNTKVRGTKNPLNTLTAIGWLDSGKLVKCTVGAIETVTRASHLAKQASRRLHSVRLTQIKAVRAQLGQRERAIQSVRALRERARKN